MESIEEPQEFVLPSSSQQLAVENQKPATESIKELMKVDTSIPEKKVVTSDSDYNALYKSIESAGKAVGQTVEKSKASAPASPISTVTTPEGKELSGKINNEVVSLTTNAEKKQEGSANNAKDKVTDSPSKVSSGEKVLSASSIENKNNEVIPSAKPAIDMSLAAPTITMKDKIEESFTKTQPVEKSLSVTASEKKNIEVVMSPINSEAEQSQPTPTISSKEKGAESVTSTPLAEKVLAAIATDNDPSKKAINEVSSIATEVNDVKLNKDEPKFQTKAAIDSNTEKKINEKAALIVAVEKETTSPVDVVTPTTSSDEKSLALRMEAAGKAGSGAVQPKNTDLPNKQALDSSSTDSLPVSKNVEAKQDAINTASASTTKAAPISASKSESSDEKSLALSMEAAGKAGSDLVQPATTAVTSEKPTIDVSPTYDSLFKKIEAAGKVSDEGTKTTDIAAEQVSPSGSNVIASTNEIVDGFTNKLEPKVASVEISPILPSSLTQDTPQDSSSSGVYMKEAVSALSSLGLPKLTVPSSNSPDYKLPTVNAPELSMPTFDMPDLKIPSLNIPELRLPDIELPSMEDIPLATKVVAGVFAVGSAGVAIALSLNGEETVGSTMPIGAKKKGTSYLEGLSRSSTTLPNKGANGSSSGSNSYLNNLAANAVSPAQGQTTSAPFDFSPKSFDSSAEASRNNERPVLTAIQESNVSPSFNFAPTANANTGNDNVATRPVNGGNNLGVPNGEKKNDSGSPSFNFSPKLFDLASKRGSPAVNGQGGNANSGPKPEPPMGRESVRDNSKDWGNSGGDGGYVWRDPVQQNPGTGVGSYLDNLAGKSVGPNPDASPTNPNGGSYNSYLDAMNRQTNQQYQDSNQPSTIKSFSKTPRTGSYVDSL